jgi:ornithine carbamoyltransferase
MTSLIKKVEIIKEKLGLSKIHIHVDSCVSQYSERIEDVISSDYFVGYEFKKNLMYVQQAAIVYCLLN